MIVVLTYFSATTGSYYTEGRYRTKMGHMNTICNEVKTLMSKGELPGIMRGHKEFVVHVRVPDLIGNRPKLIFPEGGESDKG